MSVQGRVELRPAAGTLWNEAILDAVLCPGDSLRTGGESRAAILLTQSRTVIRVDERTTVILAHVAADRSLLDLLSGAIHFLSRVPRSLEVRTPYVNAGIEGTEVMIRADTQLERTFATVFEGTLGAGEGPERLKVRSGDSMVAAPGEGPRLAAPTVVADGRAIAVAPRDTVAWSIHYPPVLVESATSSGTRSDISEAVRLLAVGRADRAGPIVDEALARDPGDAVALSVAAIMALSRSAPDEARVLSTRALDSDPQSVPALIAASYVRQGEGELGPALDLLESAVDLTPDNPLAWTRLAELRFALGYRQEADMAIRRAIALPPPLSRTQTVAGFVALSLNHDDAAFAAFEKAVTLDSADPLARLGLGLARIADGELEAGRTEIEIATILDPENAIVRSYLGKAYFEEGEYALAETQYALAAERDPADPTPWLYAAIQLLTQNRPVEALAALGESIRRNENRAVYRSRLQLDQDLATRGTARARIYEELGFERRAVVDATRSLTLSPADHSAHRFLADSYATLPRHEIARSSELLQSQLLQPVNINPVQPQSTGTDLNIVTGIGPSNIALNEFTPVFQSDGVRLDLSGFGGTQGTYGDEAILSGIQDGFSFSLGQFHYHSDGFRTNNDVTHDIYNAFLQAEVTDDLDIQFEYRRRRTDQGDLRLNFDPGDFLPFERRDIEEDIYRLGAHYAPAPGHDFIASFIYGEGGERIDDVLPPGILFDSDESDESYDGQARYIYQGRDANLTAGFAITRIDADAAITFDSTPLFGPLCGMLPFPCVTQIFPDASVDQHNVYAYADIPVLDGVIATLGLSYDGFSQGPLDIDRINPKAGLQWDITEDVRLRLAYLRTVKRALISDQTLEPTHVAGFNQFFDDVDGTRTERFGAALDVTLSDTLYGGVEVSRRNLEVPTIVPMGPGPPVIVEDQRENAARAYLYWAPDPRWAFRFEAAYEDIERDPLAPLPLPTSVETISFPVSAAYFHPSGLYARAGATFVFQEVGLPPGSLFPRDDDSFFVVDAGVGYRLPDRRGLIELEATNLLDERFLFQDPNIQDQEPGNPAYIPELAVMLRVTLSF